MLWVFTLVIASQPSACPTGHPENMCEQNPGMCLNTCEHPGVLIKINKIRPLTLNYPTHVCDKDGIYARWSLVWGGLIKPGGLLYGVILLSQVVSRMGWSY